MIITWLIQHPGVMVVVFVIACFLTVFAWGVRAGVLDETADVSTVSGESVHESAPLTTDTTPHNILSSPVATPLPPDYFALKLDHARADGNRDGRTDAGRTADAFDITKLRAQIEAEVWQQVRGELKERQRKSLDTYLVENWQRPDAKGKMKPVRRVDIYGLLGQRDDDVRKLIEELEDERERARIRALPLDPALERMVPLPPEVVGVS